MWGCARICIENMSLYDANPESRRRSVYCAPGSLWMMRYKIRF